jgi:hypothetical protein
VAKLLAILLLLMAGPVRAAIIFGIEASERGFVCNPSPSCGDNNGASPTNNYIAGNLQVLNEQFRDWFEFAIPNFSGQTLASADLFLREPLAPPGHSGGPLTYAVYGLSARPFVFTDVTTSKPFGSVGTSSADNGTDVDIPLNVAALAAITAAEGENLFMGGIDSGELNALDAHDFARTQVLANATLSFVFQTVPEPNTILFLATILGIFGIGLRKRRVRVAIGARSTTRRRRSLSSQRLLRRISTYCLRCWVFRNWTLLHQIARSQT